MLTRSTGNTSFFGDSGFFDFQSKVDHSHEHYLSYLDDFGFRQDFLRNKSQKGKVSL